MSKLRCVIGVDSSTTSTKVIAFDLHGQVIRSASRSYACVTEKPGWVEQDANEWWRAFREACGEVTGALEPAGTELLGIAVTHQRFSFVPVDAEMQPLRRAILWNDLRCAAEAEAVRESIGEREVFRMTGYPPGQWSLYKALWLKANEPELYARTHKLLLVHDLIAHRLTGSLATSESSAAMTGALDIENRSRWAGELLDECGIRRDIWVDTILPAGALLGRVHGDAAEETGLPEGLPVYAGAGDQPCGSLGAGVSRPGQLGINGGTSCSNEFIVSNLPTLDTPDFFVEIIPGGGYIVENDIPAGGSAVMNWYRSRFGDEDVRAAERAGFDPWDTIYGLLSETPPGNRGFMIVPYLQGVYGPYWDQNARGVFLGVQTDHDRTHLVRALLEGVAYEARREVDLMRAATGVEVEEIRMYGGSARSEGWNRIFADMFGKTLCVPETAETTSLGAAICAAVGAGAYPTFAAASQVMTRVRSRYEADLQNTALYDRFYTEIYSELYERVRELIGRTVDINGWNERRTLERLG